MADDTIPPDTTEQPKSGIPLDECIDRMVYRINSRNLGFGVFREATKGFIGIREKFWSYYLFEEYHYDTGAPFGTARAEVAVEMLPEGIEVKSTAPLFDYLSELEVRAVTEDPPWARPDSEMLDFEIPGYLVYRSTRPLGHRGMRGGWGADSEYECGTCGLQAWVKEGVAVGPATAEPCIAREDD